MGVDEDEENPASEDFIVDEKTGRIVAVPGRTKSIRTKESCATTATLGDGRRGDDGDGSEGCYRQEPVVWVERPAAPTPFSQLSLDTSESRDVGFPSSSGGRREDLEPPGTPNYVVGRNFEGKFSIVRPVDASNML